MIKAAEWLDALSFHEPAEIPAGVSAGSDIEKNEAEQYRQFAPVADRPESMGRVRAEIGNGHFAAGHKSGNGGEQSQSDQHASAELDDAGDEHQGIVEFARAPENAEKLLRAMTRVQESRYEAHQAVNLIGIPVQNFHQFLAFLVMSLSLSFQRSL